MSNVCQSCGMPMRKDPGQGGTQVDGSKSADYCSLCYQGGVFTRPEFSVADMQALCVAKMREMGFPRFMARWFVKRMPKLKRWREAT